MKSHKRLWTGVLGMGLGLAACDSDKSEDTTPQPDAQVDTGSDSQGDSGEGDSGQGDTDSSGSDSIDSPDSGHSDSDIPVEAGPLKSLRMPASGLVYPDTPFEVSGKVEADQVVRIRSESSPSEVFSAQADASGDFVLVMQLPAGKHDLSVSVSEGQVNANAYVLGTYVPLVSQYLVTPHRYSNPTFNAARLVRWDKDEAKGEVRLSLGKVSRVSADSASDWASQPIQNLSFVSAFTDTCATEMSEAVELSAPSGGVLSKGVISQAEPNLYGYFVDAEGVRSECTFISKGHGEFSLAVAALTSKGVRPNLTGRAWVVGPHGLLSEVGIANGAVKANAPLGVGIAVEEHAYRELDESFSPLDRVTLSLFWDLSLEQPNLRSQQVFLDEVIFTKTPEYLALNSWVWGPCGVSNKLSHMGDLSNTGEGIWGFWVALNTQCDAAGNAATYHHFNAQTPDLFGQTRGHVGSEVGLLAGSVLVDLEKIEPSDSKVPTQWESDFGEVAVEVSGLALGAHPIRISAWPESAWYTGSVHAFLSEGSASGLTATLHQMGSLLDGQGMVGLSEEAAGQERLFARTQRASNGVSFNLSATSSERLPNFVSQLGLVEVPSSQTSHFDPTQLSLEAISSLKAERFGLDYPVRGHVVVSGRPQAQHNRVTVRHFEQFWMLDFGGWPQVAWEGGNEVALDVLWDQGKVEINFLGFLEETPWNWVLGARHLNAHAQTFATSYQGQAREALQVIKGSWTF